MKMIHKNSIFVLTTIALLLFQLAVPVTAFADDDPLSTLTDTPAVTPTPDPIETTLPETDSPTPILATDTPEPPSATPATPTPDVSSPQTTVLAETSTPAPEDISTSTPTEITTPEPPATEATETQTPLLETVGTITDTTSIVVLDENGQPVSLVSQEASEIVTTGDPVWCPAGQAPTPGLHGCTISYTTIEELVASEGPNIAASGTIWITSGPVADTNPVFIDGGTYTNWANYSLTLQGGWNGVNGSTVIGSNSVFSNSITIYWNNNVTINNITSESGGVTVMTNENILINNVEGSNAEYGGYFSSFDGDITINNSNFSNNSYDGLNVGTSSGNININNSNFSNNSHNGLNAASDYGNIYLKNSNFSDNGYVGSYAYAAYGNIVVTKSTFDNNGHYGATLGSGAGNVIVNKSTFNNNVFIGAGLGTGTGNIIVNNSTFNNNTIGADMGTYTGNIILKNSDFNNNGYIGISSNPGSGQIFIDGSTVNSSMFGLYLSGTPLNIVITNSSITHNGVGLFYTCEDIWYTPNITLGNVILNNNDIDITMLDPSLQNECFWWWKSIHQYSFETIFDAIFYTIVSDSSQSEITINCTDIDGITVILPNGDQVQVFCPVSGKARISRLDNTSLPADLPQGFIYASAFNLEIFQGIKNDISIPVVTEDGFIRASFDASHLQSGATYSILYFDKNTSTWIPLKDFMLDEKGNTLSFDLLPGDPENQGRQILSGVNSVVKDGTPRVEVSTNFPGTFVLVQQ